MAQETIPLQVSSSWLTANHKALRDAITVTPLSSVKRDEDGSLTDMVELDSCVLLAQPVEENGNENAVPEPCSITIHIDGSSASVITEIVVVCQARIIEVYGAHNEYLTTSQAELLDEIEDTSVYCASIKLNQPTQDCTLKFARLSRATDMWLYGIKLIWNVQETLRKHMGQKSGLNFQSVEQRLKESHTQLSDRAQSCKQFIQMYTSMNGQKNSIDPTSLFSLLPVLSGQKQANPQDNFNLHSIAKKFQSVTIPSSSSSTPSDRFPQEDSDKSICNRCSKTFESMLEKQLLSMENRLMKALDEKIGALQQHQDREIQNLFHLFLESKVSVDAGLRPKDENHSSDLISPNQDVKIEQAIKKLVDQKSVLTCSRAGGLRRNSPEEKNDSSILRNALIALQLNDIYAGTSCQSVLDSTGTPVVQSGP